MQITNQIADPMTKEQRAAKFAQAEVGYERVTKAKTTPDNDEYEWEEDGMAIAWETKYAATLGGFVISKGGDPFRFDSALEAISYAGQLRAEQYKIAQEAGLLP